MSEEKPVVLTRLSHVVIAVGVWLVSLGTLYGTVRAQIDELQRAQQEDRQDFVRRDRFEEAQDDIKQRLERIERKLDTEKSLRELDEGYAPKRH